MKKIWEKNKGSKEIKKETKEIKDQCTFQQFLSLCIFYIEKFRIQDGMPCMIWASFGMTSCFQLRWKMKLQPNQNFKRQYQYWKTLIKHEKNFLHKPKQSFYQNRVSIRNNIFVVFILSHELFEQSQPNKHRSSY